MPTITQANLRYTPEELRILQEHVDWYRNLPEALSLQGLGIEHRAPGDAETCRNLAEKGILKIEPVDKREAKVSRSFATRAEGEQAVAELFSVRDSDLTVAPPDSRRRSSWEFAWTDHVSLPGARAFVTETGSEEIVRLYKAGQLKRNDW